MAETQRFGLEKFGGPYGGAITDDGGKYSTVDRDTLDRLLFAYERHIHDAAFDATALIDPTDAPAGTIATTGGTLPGASTYYYRVSYIDQYGLESAGSDELSLSTEEAPIVTDPPVVNGDSTVGNTLPTGTYYYALTALSSQGESSLGPQAIITTQPGQTGVLLTLPAMDNGITAYNVWRHGISDAGWTKVGINVSDSTYLDVGVPTGTCLTDPATQPPNSVTFTVTGTNAATITVPDTALVGQVLGPVRAWRLYRTDTSGNYGTESLVAEIVAADDATALATSYVDTGASLLAGQPLLTSTTLTPSRRIFDAGDTLPDVTGYPNEALFLNTSVPAFFALIDGAWAQLGGASSGGGFALVLPDSYRDYFDMQPMASSGLGITLTQGVEQALTLTMGADVVSDSGGLSMSFTDDGAGHFTGFKAETDGDYTLWVFPKILGLAPGDVVRVIYRGFEVPGSSIELNYTIPPGVTGTAAENLTDHNPFTAQVRCAAGNSIRASIMVFSAAAATLDYFDFAMEIEAGTLVTDMTLVPSAVQDLALDGSGNLSFTDPASTGVAPIEDYLVQYGSTKLSWDTTSGTLTGVTTGQIITVQARTARGFGAIATVVSP